MRCKFQRRLLRLGMFKSLLLNQAGSHLKRVTWEDEGEEEGGGGGGEEGGVQDHP